MEKARLFSFAYWYTIVSLSPVSGIIQTSNVRRLVSFPFSYPFKNIVH